MWLNIRLLLRILFWPPLAVAAYGIILGHNHLHVGYGLFLFIETVLLPMIDLAAKKCVPCNSKDLQAMTEESANDLLSKVFILICVFVHFFMQPLFSRWYFLGCWVEFGE
jgi:hypothetical protein